MKMKRPRPVYVYVEKKRLPRAKKSSSGEGAPRSRSNTPIGSSGQEKRKATKTKPDEPTKKSSLRVLSSNAFGEMSATKRPTTSLHHHHPTSKNRRPSDWSSGRGYGESSDTQGRRSGKGSSREDSKRDDHYRYSNDNNLLNNFEICSSSRSDTQRHRHHRKRKNYTITLCFDLPTNSSSHQLLPPPPPPPPPPPQPLPIRPVGSAAFSQCMSMSAPFAANQTNMSDCLSAYGGYIGNNMSSAFGQYNPNWNNGQTGYNNQQQQQPQQNTLGLYGSPMQYGTQAAPNFMNPTPQFSNIGSYGSNNFANNNMSNMNNYGYGLGLGFGGDNSSSLNNYGFGYDAAAYSAAAAAISAAASTPVASAPFTPAANTSNAFATSAALANDPATKPRENYFSKTSHGYNYYNSGYPPVSQPPIYSQFTSSNYFNNNYLGSLDNLKAQNTYANPYNSGNYGGQQYCNYPYNYNSSPSYGYNYRPSNHAFNHQVPVSASFSAANHITTPTPQYQYNEVYSVPYGTGANFVNELIHRSLQNNQQCFGYNSAAFPSPSSSRQSFNCLCLCFPENFRRPPNAFYHHFKRPPINTRYYHHRRTHHRSGLYDFSDSDYINNLIC